MSDYDLLLFGTIYICMPSHSFTSPRLSLIKSHLSHNMGETFKHPEIGEVKYATKEGVQQFLGIQYATIKDRFAPAVLREYNGEGVDATKIG